MAQGVISKKYLIDMAEAIRVKLNSQSAYTPTQMANAISQITGEISGTITKSTNTDTGLITDSIVTGICDALRLKLDDSTLLLTPSQIADAILSIQSGAGLPDFDVIGASTGIVGRAQYATSETTSTKGTTYDKYYKFYYESDSDQACGWRIYGYATANTCSMINAPVPAGYKKLYIDIYSSGTSGAYNLSTMYLRSAYGVTGYYGGNFAGTNLKTVGFCSYSQTYDQLAAQTGVSGFPSGSGKAYSLSRRTITVDISGITQDMYIGWHRCDNQTTIYSIIAKDS